MLANKLCSNLTVKVVGFVVIVVSVLMPVLTVSGFNFTNYTTNYLMQKTLEVMGTKGKIISLMALVLKVKVPHFDL